MKSKSEVSTPLPQQEFENHLKECSAEVAAMPEVIRKAARASMGLPQREAALPQQEEPADISKRSRLAAQELLSFLSISYPRGTSYQNSIEENIAICIEQNMRGNHR